MAVGIQNYPNVTVPDSDYPDGKSKDNTGFNDGTPVNTLTRTDHQQWFAKLLREAEITANGLPDNNYNGWQNFDASDKIYNKYGSSYIVNANLNLPLSAAGARMFNPFILIPPGAASGLEILLPSIDNPKELSTMTIVNDSSNAVTVVSTLWQLDYVLPTPFPGPPATYSIPAGKTIEITFITISGQYNWIISKKP